MDLTPAFERCRKLIEVSLRDFFEAKGGELEGVNRWGRDLTERFLRFSLNGKMIRGGLVILAYGMFAETEKLSGASGDRERDDAGRTSGNRKLGDAGRKGGDPGRSSPSGGSPSTIAFPGDPPRWVVDAAASYELIHSSLLVHDDIMDRDRVRRGEPTIFHQYEELGRGEGTLEPGHFGRSLGICAGDVGFFLAFEMLTAAAAGPGPGGIDALDGASAAMTATPGRVWKILRLWARELTAVGLAQMEDVALGASSRAGGEKEILNLYRYKTARYTFSIPLATGAIAAGSGPKTVSRLEELGEDLGILFQMKDDEIGFFGDEGETGKPPGSDIEEGKQTLIARALSEKGGEEYANIAARMRRRSAELKAGPSGGLGGCGTGNRQGSHADLASLRALAEGTGVLRSLDRIREPIRARAEELIESLGVGREHRSFLRELLRYNLERRR